MGTVKKITALLLAILIIGYAGGLNVAKHLCDGKVVSKALNSEVKVCKKASCEFPLSDDYSISKLPCCKTVSNFFQADQFAKGSIDFDFFSSFYTSFFSAEITTESRPFYAVKDYSPPLLNSPPIYITIEQYLI